MPSSLLTDIVAHWRLEENGTATRVDAHTATYGLATAGGLPITAVAGKINNAAHLLAVHLFRNVADGIFNPLTSFTIALWFKADAADLGAGNFGLASFTLGTGIDWVLSIQSGEAVMTVGGVDSPPVTVPDTGWHFYLAWYDADAGTVNLQLDNGVIVSAGSVTPTQDGDQLQLGNESDTMNPPDGTLDSVSFWSRKLTSPERSTIWNAGAGLDYPFDAVTPTTGVQTMSNSNGGGYTTRNSGEIFVQVNGPNTKPEWLGTCVDAGDLAEDKGGLKELLQCFDGKGGWMTRGALYNPPGAIDFNLSTYIGDKLGILELLGNCNFPLYFNMGRCGRAGNFANFKRNYALRDTKLVMETTQGIAAEEEDKETRGSWDFSAWPPVVKFLPLTIVRVTIGETDSLNDLAFSTDNVCSGPCGAASDAGDEGMVTENTGSGGVPDHAWHTSNGATFAQTAANPFGNDKAIGAITRIDIGGTYPRYIAARGTTTVGAPMSIAYTDDLGATWTTVTVGAVNGEFAAGNECLFALDSFNIWLCVSDGYIYKSEDAGASWTAKSAGVDTTESLTCIKFYDADLGYAAGDNNTLLITQDGGETWAALTGPSAQATVEINTIMPVSPNRIWVGYNDGDWYYSEDKGATWSVRSLPVTAVSIRSTDWIDELHGLLVVNLAGPVGRVLFTVDGGFTWVSLTTPENDGLNAVQFINPRLAWIVGEVEGSSAVLLKAFVP